MCRGEEARSLVTLRVSVLVKNRKKKEILTCYGHWKASACGILKYL